MTHDVATRERLLEDMRESGRRFVAAVREIPAERWPEGRYEEGWTAKDILAHVASIEWTYPKLLDLARGAGDKPRPTDSAGDKPRPTGSATGKPPGLPGDYNQRHVEKRRDNTVDELLGEFERNRAATIEAVGDADDEVLGTEVRSAGGVEGSAAEVLTYLTV